MMLKTTSNNVKAKTIKWILTLYKMKDLLNSALIYILFSIVYFYFCLSLTVWSFGEKHVTTKIRFYHFNREKWEA